MTQQKTYIKGDAATEATIKLLINNLQGDQDADNIEKTVSAIRKLSSNAAYQAGKDAGYRNGFQTAITLN